MGGAKIPEGVPISLGNLAWGCQILGGARFPMTPGYSQELCQKGWFGNWNVPFPPPPCRDATVVDRGDDLVYGAIGVFAGLRQ